MVGQLAARAEASFWAVYCGYAVIVSYWDGKSFVPKGIIDPQGVQGIDP